MHKQELTELANKLFMYTDAQRWSHLLSEVFTEDIWFDMSSLGAGAPSKIKAAELCNMWKEGFKDIDHVHHQAGHYLIDVTDDNKATIYAYAVAYHYRQAAQNGRSRSYIGSYDLGAMLTPNGWRLNQFTYNLKFIDGNKDLQ